jgi:hypothetical protein
MIHRIAIASINRRNLNSVFRCEFVHPFIYSFGKDDVGSEALNLVKSRPLLLLHANGYRGAEK